MWFCGVELFWRVRKSKGRWNEKKKERKVMRGKETADLFCFFRELSRIFPHFSRSLTVSLLTLSRSFSQPLQRAPFSRSLSLAHLSSGVRHRIRVRYPTSKRSSVSLSQGKKKRERKKERNEVALRAPHLQPVQVHDQRRHPLRVRALRDHHGRRARRPRARGAGGV